MAKWILNKKAGNASELSKALNISPIAARALINRGIKSAEEAARFLSENASLKDFEDAEHILGLTQGLEIVKTFIEKKEKIIIYGDYDADGVTSAVMLLKSIRFLNGAADYYIPDRRADGYGLNAAAVTRFANCGYKLLVCCDNGISGIDEVSLANELGMTVVIIDHHEPGDIIPPAAAVIDPKQKNCPYAFKSMCAAGLSFRFVLALFDLLNTDFPFFSEFSALAAIGTVCDIVDLLGENRLLVKIGLASINKDAENIGLAALIAERGLKKAIGVYETGFVLGPCINAAGRLKSADLAAELFLTNDAARAADLAAELSELNEQRKTITEKSLRALSEKISEDDKVIVVYDENVSESVAGIIASRIKDVRNRPAIVLADSAQEGILKGSARSIPDYDMFSELTRVSDLLLRFGGHAGAAGLSLKIENLTALKNALNANCPIDNFEEKIYIDAQLGFPDITLATAREIKTLGPFGKGNPEPLFGIKNCVLVNAKTYDEKNVTRLSLKPADGGRYVTGVYFGATDKIKEMLPFNAGAQNPGGALSNGAGTKLDIVCGFTINDYYDPPSAELIIKDFRLSTV